MNQAAVGKDFILAGRAILTMIGKSDRYTFKIRRADPTEQNPNPSLYFVSVLTGPTSWTYMGVLNPSSGRLTPSKGSKVPTTDPAFVAAAWAFPAIFRHGRLPGGQVLHAGRCGRCAKVLTDPDSIRSGFGPDCRQKVGQPVTPGELAEDYKRAGYQDA